MNAGSHALDLLDGEKILWSGAPAAGVRLQARDVFMIPFSLLWCGFAIFWEYSVSSHRRVPVFFILWGIPFVLVGLFMVVGRFFVDAWLRGRTRYALTNQRILIHRAAPLARFTALSLRQLPDMSLTEHAQGRGTIRFGEPAGPFAQRNGIAGWIPALDPTAHFIAVDNAATLFRQIQQAQREAQTG
jgi:hypothetical protein